jgi:hypothetical protein
MRPFEQRHGSFNNMEIRASKYGPNTLETDQNQSDGRILFALNSLNRCKPQERMRRFRFGDHLELDEKAGR